MHGDLNLSNVRADAHGQLMGIVYIEALRAGCRAIDYATLWHSSADDGDAVGLSLVRAAGNGRPAEGFVACALWRIASEYILSKTADGATALPRTANSLAMRR